MFHSNCYFNCHHLTSSRGSFSTRPRHMILGSRSASGVVPLHWKSDEMDCSKCKVLHLTSSRGSFSARPRHMIWGSRSVRGVVPCVATTTSSCCGQPFSIMPFGSAGELSTGIRTKKLKGTTCEEHSVLLGSARQGREDTAKLDNTKCRMPTRLKACAGWTISSCCGQPLAAVQTICNSAVPGPMALSVSLCNKP